VRLVLALGLGSLAACLGDSVTATVPIPGTWTLQSVNGQPLPYTFANASTLTSDVLTINASGSFSETATFKDGTSFTATGAYSSVNGFITFSDQTNGVIYYGQVNGAELVEQNNGFTERFTRS
jgi:hypothetical protein